MAILSIDGSLTDGNYRSGEAAKLAQMPVTRLRLWERRYEVVGPAKRASGQRRYSNDDVQRLILIDSLVKRGHAIGAIARLEREQLEFLAAGSTPTPKSHTEAPTETSDIRLTLVGERLGRRLADGSIDVVLYGITAVTSYTEMAMARECGVAAGEDINILLLWMPSLHQDDAAEALALADAYGAKAIAVVYGFGKGSAVESLRLAGVRLYREPDSRSELGQILADLCRAARAQQMPLVPSESALWSRAPRRYGDEELEVIAARSSTIACECPRHLAELVSQLSTFEAYSDQCTSRSPRDEALHRFLGDTANRARALIESALAHVIHEEG